MKTPEKFKRIKDNNNELMNNEFSAFTDSEMRTIYSLAEIYGGDDKVELVKELKSLLLYERAKIKGKILTAIKNV